MEELRPVSSFSCRLLVEKFVKKSVYQISGLANALTRHAGSFPIAQRTGRQDGAMFTFGNRPIIGIANRVANVALRRVTGPGACH